MLLAAVAGFAGGPAHAVAATLEPCEAAGPGGPVVELDGELSLEPLNSTRKAWRRSGVRQGLIRPANNMAGRPAFPVRTVRYGATARVDLRGGLRVVRGKRVVPIRGLHAFSAPGRPALLRGSVGRRTINLFQVRGGKRTYDAESGELSRVGVARLLPAAARILNRNLRTGRKHLRAGTVWGYFNLYSLYTVTEPDDPTGEAPEAPPVKPQPAGALGVASAPTVKWYVRDSFINYIDTGVAPGDGTRALNGAIADPPTGSLNLSYSYNFPFTSGWTVPADDGEPATLENTLLRGSGTVGFRYCDHTINFTVSDPEIEIDGDENSRLIFRVNGTDGTEYPDQRAVMVKLIPSQAESRNVTDLGGGISQVSYEKIPGFIPAESTGIFADFYPSYDPELEGINPRPDRFGHLSITYTFAEGDS